MHLLICINNNIHTFCKSMERASHWVCETFIKRSGKTEQIRVEKLCLIRKMLKIDAIAIAFQRNKKRNGFEGNRYGYFYIRYFIGCEFSRRCIHIWGANRMWKNNQINAYKEIYKTEIRFRINCGLFHNRTLFRLILDILRWIQH